MTAMAQTHGKRVFNSLIWAAVRIWGNRLGGLLVFFILARLLTPEDFGVYASLWALLLFLEGGQSPFQPLTFREGGRIGTLLLAPLHLGRHQ